MKLVFLGFYNKILGGIFGVVKLFTILSIIFVLFEDLNSKFNIIEINVLNESFAFEKTEISEKYKKIEGFQRNSKKSQAFGEKLRKSKDFEKQNRRK